MERWCQTNAIGSLRGRCRVHRAEILRLRGACDEAEHEALTACDELRPYLRREMGWPLSELGRIRLRKGDIGGAEEALLAAHRVGWEPQPGLALVRLAQGDAAAAAASIREALDRPLAGAFEGAATRHRPSAGADARGAGRDRDRGRRPRPSGCCGRRAGARGRPIPEQGAGRRRDPGSRKGAARPGSCSGGGTVLLGSRTTVEPRSGRPYEAALGTKGSRGGAPGRWR